MSDSVLEKVFLGITIPTYNERENIIELLKKIDNVLSEIGVRYHIVVVDDNSPDGTAEIVRKYGNETGVVDVIVRPGKLGLGSAILTGMKKLLEKHNVTHIVTMDADLSHRPEDLPNLLEYIDKADLVQGSRYISGGRIIGWGFHRKLISWTANRLVNLLYHTRQRDHTNNYRLYSRKVVEDLIKYSTMNSYEWVIEALLITYACGYRVAEAPTIFINREKGRSKLGFRDIVKWWLFIVKYKGRFKEVMNMCRK